MLAITHIEDVTEQRRTAERLQLCGDPRRAHRAAQPHRADAPASTRSLADAARRRGRGAVRRPRQLQDGQRQPRPRHRRHAADGDVGAPARASSAPTTCSPGSAATSSSSCCDDSPSAAPMADRRGRAGAVREPVDGRRAPSCSSRASIGVSVNDRDGVTRRRPAARRRRRDVPGQGAGRDCVEAFAPGTPRDRRCRRCARRPSCGAASSAARSCRTSSRSSS